MAPLHPFHTLFKGILLLWLFITSAWAGHHAIKGASHGVHPRMEIRTMYLKHPDMFNIYIQALKAFQKEKQSKKLSYYQIGGIHGEPNIPWDGVQQTADGTGYCNHNSPLFPTWHRPYVALFEEQLGRHAMKIAKKFKGHARKKYMKQAKKLRQPYWDWAIQPEAGQPALPKVMTSKHVTVITPKHGKQSIENPLYAYHYHPVESQYYAAPWNAWKRTLRYPTSEAPSAKSRDAAAANSLNYNRASTQSELFLFFTKCKTWLEMSNDNVVHHSPGCSTSLEQLHNNIHTQIGGYFPIDNGASYFGGHMTAIPYSAHEPSFFLHHTQIDRLFAMWQALHPHVYVASGPALESTFTIQQGEILNKHSPLKPFHKNHKGDFYNSVDVRSTRVFGYTYPELQHAGHSAKKMRHQINHMYGPKASKHAAKRGLLANAVTANNGSLFMWNANIATPRFQLGDSYNVYVFFGEPTSNDASVWSYDPNSAGTMGVFAGPGMEKDSSVISGVIPLTDKLTEVIQNGDLATLGEEDVIPYLTKNMNVKIVGPKGIMQATDVPNFDIQVVASTLKTTEDLDEFPTWSPFIPLPHITANILGGAGGILNGIGIGNL